MTNHDQPALMCSTPDEIRRIVKEEVDTSIQKVFDGQRRDRRWVIGVFGGIAVLVAASGISDHTRLNDHVKDGHPHSVMKIVHDQAVLLGELKTGQDHAIRVQDKISADLDILKKKLINE